MGSCVVSSATTAIEDEEKGDLGQYEENVRDEDAPLMPFDFASWDARRRMSGLGEDRS
jgi:hypothetical protein